MIWPHTEFFDVPNRSMWSLTYNLPRLEILREILMAGVLWCFLMMSPKIKYPSPPTFGQLCHSTLDVIGRDLLFTMGREIRYLVDLSDTVKGAFAFFDHPPVWSHTIADPCLVYKPGPANSILRCPNSCAHSIFLLPFYILGHIYAVGPPFNTHSPALPATLSTTTIQTETG